MNVKSVELRIPNKSQLSEYKKLSADIEKEIKDFNKGACYITKENIGRYLGVSQNTVNAYLERIPAYHIGGSAKTKKYRVSELAILLAYEREGIPLYV